MKGFIFLFLLNASLISSDIENTPASNQFYLFTYIFNNPSAGPVVGTDRERILMKNGYIISAWSLITGLENKNIRSFSTLMDAINGNTQDLQVEYDSNNFPKKIVPIINEIQEGGWYSIEIKDFKYISDLNYTIDIKQIRMNDLKANYQKWRRFNAEKYSYIYKDSREKDLHMDGVWVAVDNEKIIKARDNRSYQPIADIENRSLLTIDRFFAFVKKSLEENQQLSVLYHGKYGYPYWIDIKDHNGNQYTIYSRNFRKEF